MRYVRFFLSFLVCALALFEATSTARAQDPAPVAAETGARSAYPSVVVDRPLTLTQGLLRVDGGFSVVRILGETGTGLALGAGIGLIDDIEVGATVLPLSLSPSVEYGDPNVYASFRFLRGDVELGARLNVPIPIDGPFSIDLTIPVRIHAVPSVFTIDTGLSASYINATDVVNSSEGILLMQIPLALTFNVTPAIFASVQTGVIALNLRGTDAFDNLAMPLGFGAGYTIAGAEGPLADVGASFSFPALVTRDGTTTDYWTLGVFGRAYVPVF